mgnify:CR=1 FL=1
MYNSLSLPTLLPQVVEATRDPEYSVREGAQYALLQLAEQCYPTILYHHSMLVPAIVCGLDDPEPSVQRLACLHAEHLFEQLHSKTVAHYLPEIMPKLISLMTSPIDNVKKFAISATGPIGGAAEKLFKPYLQVSNLHAL